MEFGIVLTLYMLLLPLTYIGVIFSMYGNQREKDKGWFAKLNDELSKNLGRIMLFVYLAVLPIFVAGCIFGYFQRRSNDKAVKTLANLVGVLGVIWFAAIGYYISVLVGK